jgi:hypothetical protein
MLILNIITASFKAVCSYLISAPYFVFQYSLYILDTYFGNYDYTINEVQKEKNIVKEKLKHKYLLSS